MIKTIQKLLLAAVMFAAPSCLTDEVERGGPGKHPKEGAEVVLRLKTPGNFATPKTRALNYAQENDIADVYVLVFDTDNELVEIKKADSWEDETDTMTAPEGGYSGEGTFTVTLSQVGDGNTYNLVVLANAGAFLKSCGFIDNGTDEFITTNTGDTYAEVVAALYGEFGGKLYTDGTGTIPMWGMVEETQIPLADPDPIEMTRALARIDVGVGAVSGNDTDASPPVWNGRDSEGAAIPFTMTGIYVMKPNDRYAIMPTAAGTLTPAGAKYVQTTGEITTDYRFHYAVSGNSFARNIYLPEAEIDGAAHTERMAIVVAGKYNDGAITYYRLDFAKQSDALVDVMRNHLYRFTITGVDGPGYATVEEAYAARPINIYFDTEVIKDGDYGYVFDDQYYLAYAPGEFTLEGYDVQPKELNIETDYTTWTATVRDAENSTATSTTSWLKISYNGGAAGYTTTGDGGAGISRTITLHTTANPSFTASRTAWIHITAGRMTAKIEVTQLPNIPLASPGVIGYIKGTNTLTLSGSKEYKNTLVDNAETRALFGPISDQTVYVAYFKWGSLIATGSHPAHAAYPAFAREDIVAWPDDYNIDGLRTLIGTKTGPAAWGSANNKTIPYNTDTPTGWPVTPGEGLGDPCVYYFDQREQFNGGGWRLPTGNSWYKDGGSPFGTTDHVGANWKLTTGTGAGAMWVDNENPDHPEFHDLPINGIVASNGNGGENWSMFLPAAGHRVASTGGNPVKAEASLYWSSTSNTNIKGGYTIEATYSSVRPSLFPSRDSGSSVRCVRNE